MAWGDHFNKMLYLREAREAYEGLTSDEKLTVDAAIVKRLSRDAYDAALRIYDLRDKKASSLVDIFDGIVKDYTEPDRITMLRGYMVGFNKTADTENKIHLAHEELADTGNSYQTMVLSESEAREIARDGIECKTFNTVREQLKPCMPMIQRLAALQLGHASL